MELLEAKQFIGNVIYSISKAEDYSNNCASSNRLNTLVLDVNLAIKKASDGSKLAEDTKTVRSKL